MGYITLICPKCKTLSKNDNSCASCAYKFAEDDVLLNMVLADYNKAVQFISKKSIVKAWGIIRQAIKIYPFFLDAINLAFLLAIQNGEYGFAQEMLLRIKPYIKDSYGEQERFLKDQLVTYNQIIRQEVKFENLPKKQLSLVHLYLLFLQSNEKEKYKIFNALKKIDPGFGSMLVINSATSVKVRWAIACTIIIFIVFVGSILIKKNNNFKRAIAIEKQNVNAIESELFRLNESLNIVDNQKISLSRENEKLLREKKRMNNKLDLLRKEKEKLAQNVANRDTEMKHLKGSLLQLEQDIDAMKQRMDR